MKTAHFIKSLHLHNTKTKSHHVSQTAFVTLGVNFNKNSFVQPMVKYQNHLQYLQLFTNFGLCHQNTYILK